MIDRPFWQERIYTAWQQAPIAWLTGVRRVGKTTLAKSFVEAEYINCDLPRNRERLTDPEFFFSQCKARIIILDEVHQLENPSELLKIAADEFPRKRILATGSSTLAATRKFKDSLTGRKRVVLLPPVLVNELPLFGHIPLEMRMLRGGLPQCVLNTQTDPGFYSEWLDSYFARDVQELFNIGKRTEFLKLAEILLRNNGGLAEITSLARQTGLTRPTVLNYLNALEITHVIQRLRPFHGGGKREILAQPKIYAFDTGFVCHYHGWTELRPTDRGNLFENLALDILNTSGAHHPIQYWRDKQGREVDFVLKVGRTVYAIECKWNAAHFEPRNLETFRNHYPIGENLLVTASEGRPYKKKFGSLEIEVVPIQHLQDRLKRIGLLSC